MAFGPFATWHGSYGISSDAWAPPNAGAIQINVPAGATVVAAYLYVAAVNLFSPTGPTPPCTIGRTTTITPTVTRPLSRLVVGFAAAWADQANVTDFVAGEINGGPGGTYNFTVTQGSAGTGLALVVVYQLDSLPTQYVVLCDGAATPAGQTTTVALPFALTDPALAGFTAELRLGISFSYGASAGQSTTVSVGGTLLSSVAGGYDDSGATTTPGQAGLMTFGSDDDAFTPPNYTAGTLDHERYNLRPLLVQGQTEIVLTTANASGDDVLFAALFAITAPAPSAPPPTDYWQGKCLPWPGGLPTV